MTPAKPSINTLFMGCHHGTGIRKDDSPLGFAQLCFYATIRNTKDWGTNEEIFAAASDGDLPRLEDLVSRGANVDVQVRFVQLVTNCSDNKTGEAEFCRSCRQLVSNTTAAVVVSLQLRLPIIQ